MIRLALVPLLTASFAACGSGDSSSPGPGDIPLAPNSVNIGDNFFDPPSLAVSSGTTVTWNWVSDSYTGQAGNLHSVTFNDPLRSSATQSSGTHTLQFNETGTFGYFCSVHGAGAMSGTIVVQ